MCDELYKTKYEQACRLKWMQSFIHSLNHSLNVHLMKSKFLFYSIFSLDSFHNRQSNEFIIIRVSSVLNAVWFISLYIVNH